MPTTNGITQLIQDGQVIDTTANGNSQTSSSKTPGSLDKDAFLQLLVAQMKYQDPLQPTSNTEYISQLATFSSLEEMQNMNNTMTDLQATSLVGKQVVLKVTSEVTGTTTTVSGYVEYVMRENGKTYLVVDGNPYSIDTLESVVDEAYLDAIAMAETVREAVKKLPDAKNLTLDDKEQVEAIRDAINNMTAYQQGFLDADSLTKLQELLTQLAAMEEEASNSGNGEGADESGTTTGGEENE